jgi:LytR cell envelope-related transcriptional attenuator
VTEPAPSGGSSPLRVAGLALLGVGAVAAIVGIGTLVSGGDGSAITAAPTTSAVATTAPAATSAAAPTSAVSIPSFGPTSTNGLAAPGTSVAPSGAGTGGTGVVTGGTGSGTGTGTGSAGTGSGSGSGSGQSVIKSPVRVYNNSTITGLATRAADDFRGAGWTIETISNYPQGTIPTSTVYYRPGTSEQAAAEAMGREFGLRVEPRFVGLDEASPGLITIVTNDYQQRS